MKQLAFVVILVLAAFGADLFAQTPFYQGKSIRIIVVNLRLTLPPR